MQKRAALHNLGCKVNSYETDAMRQLLIDAGYRIVPFTSPADVYVINTCSVTNTADHKSRQMISRARKTNPDAVVCACGCFVQVKGEEVLSALPADIIIGNNVKHELIGAIRTFEQSRKKTSVIAEISDPGVAYEHYEQYPSGTHTRAFVKIQDGCDQFCSYCIIPYARGRIRSRSIPDTINEVSMLAKNGYQEIVLTGIHISSYGKECGFGGGNDKKPLLTLLDQIAGTEGIRRIRLGSLEPGIITDDFLRGLAKIPQICPHFHLSLQSGSDSVLLRMNRHYTTEDYRRRCDLIRSFYEHPAITTDVIAGFPGETQEEFDATCVFVYETAFAELHVFPYSKRSGTKAARMPDQLSAARKNARAAELINIGNELKRSFSEYYRDKTVSVLFEQDKESDGSYICTGFTPEYVKVGIISDKKMCNQIRDIEFSENIY